MEKEMKQKYLTIAYFITLALFFIPIIHVHNFDKTTYQLLFILIFSFVNYVIHIKIIEKIYNLHNIKMRKKE